MMESKESKESYDEASAAIKIQGKIIIIIIIISPKQMNYQYVISHLFYF